MFNGRFHAARGDIGERLTSIILNGDLTALTADEGKARSVIGAREGGKKGQKTYLWKLWHTVSNNEAEMMRFFGG